MNRRGFAKRGLAACAALLSVAPRVSAQLPAEKQDKNSRKQYSFKLNQPIPVEVKSAPVAWQDYDYHLLQFHNIQFSLDANSHLTARLAGRIVCFDEVTYSVGAAVFGPEDVLLGTSRTECKIGRLWAGKVLNSTADLHLDFGISLDYPGSKFFQLCVSNRTVQTPDAWQR